MIHKGYKYRFLPTNDQIQQLNKTFGCVRWIYNWGLDLKTKAWREEKKSISYYDLAKLLTQIKKQEETKFLNEISNVCLQQSLRHLDSAFRYFFNKKFSYPKFKSRKNKQVSTYSISGFTFKDGLLKLAKHKDHLNIIWDNHRFPDEVKILSISISKDNINRYFISFQIKQELNKLPMSENKIGIDVGIKNLLAYSNGITQSNPRFFLAKEKRLKRIQRKFSRKEIGSKNREKTRIKLAKMYAKVADTKRDFLHKLTTKLIRENQTIVVEGLSVVNMLKNHSLAKSISDASWGELFRQLEYKSKWYGRTFISLDRFFPSSKLCSNCGWIKEDLSLRDREWQCSSCTEIHDRDINAAKNILAAGEYLMKCTESGAQEFTSTRNDSRESE